MTHRLSETFRILIFVYCFRRWKDMKDSGLALNGTIRREDDITEPSKGNFISKRGNLL